MLIAHHEVAVATLNPTMLLAATTAATYFVFAVRSVVTRWRMK